MGSPGARSLVVTVLLVVLLGLVCPEVSAGTPVPYWAPEDECALIPNPGPGPRVMNDAVMAWCPYIAEALAEWHEAHPERPWAPGDLTRYLFVEGCETAWTGDPMANERRWGTGTHAVFGLYSHRRLWWWSRSMTALGQGRVGVKYGSYQHDDIATAIWLRQSGTQAWWVAWDSCWPSIRGTLSNIAATGGMPDEYRGGWHPAHRWFDRV